MHNADLAIAAHMEIAGPSIKDAVAECAKAGIRQVVIAPYFLSQGRHIQQDIPNLVAEAQAEHPGLQCIIAEPIGMSNPPPTTHPPYPSSSSFPFFPFFLPESFGTSRHTFLIDFQSMCSSEGMGLH